eukprot:100226-Pleurochrysis_carterae.AAC.2
MLFLPVQLSIFFFRSFLSSLISLSPPIPPFRCSNTTLCSGCGSGGSEPDRIMIKPGDHEGFEESSTGSSVKEQSGSSLEPSQEFTRPMNDEDMGLVLVQSRKQKKQVRQ